MSGPGNKVQRPWWIRDPLTAALVFSLLLHALAFGGWRLGQQLGWKEIPLPNWLKPLSLSKLLTPRPLDKKELAKLQPQTPKPPPEEREIPLTFLEIDPTRKAIEPPKNAKFYATANTKAANAEAKIETNQPKIDGKQSPMVKVIEAPKPVKPPEPKPPEAKSEAKPKDEIQPPTPQLVKVVPPQPKPEPQPLQPSVAPQPTPAMEAKPKPAEAPGDLAMAKPAKEPPLKNSEGKAEIPKVSNFEPDAPPPRPRTLREALARPENSALASERTRQEGGVKNIGMVALDAKGTLTGAYDAALIAAVRQRWHNLLGDRSTPRGTVVVTFRLHYDGRVTDVQMPSCNAGELHGLICQRAIIDPAPFQRWPSDMRRQMEADFRDVKFTFYYE